MKNIFFVSIYFAFTLFLSACGTAQNSAILENNETNLTNRAYGISLKKETVIKTFGDVTLYAPKTFDLNVTFPIVLFAPGWGSQNHNSYKTLLTFIASQGYVVLYSKCPKRLSPQVFIERFDDVLQDINISVHLDKKRLGVVGFSSGGGLSFGIMNEFSKRGYGGNGRFIFSMASWFSFGMNSKDFKNLPSDIKVVMQQYAEDYTTDPRIPLTIFSKFEVFDKKNHDYQVYQGVNHSYPEGNRTYEQMQIILKPLDALMEYTFNKNEHAYDAALKVGEDKPYINSNQIILDSEKYPYKCYTNEPYLKSVLDLFDIDYCSIMLQNN